MERIVAAAKKRGTLTMYTTFAKKDQRAGGPFEAKYGVKVNIWRAGDGQGAPRTLGPRRPRRSTTWTLILSLAEMERSSREKNCRR